MLSNEDHRILTAVADVRVARLEELARIITARRPEVMALLDDLDTLSDNSLARLCIEFVVQCESVKDTTDQLRRSCAERN